MLKTYVGLGDVHERLDWTVKCDAPLLAAVLLKELVSARLWLTGGLLAFLNIQRRPTPPLYATSNCPPMQLSLSHTICRHDLKKAVYLHDFKGRLKEGTEIGRRQDVRLHTIRKDDPLF